MEREEEMDKEWRRGEEKEDRAGEEEEWEGKRGANAECWEVAGRLSVNGSLEKRSSRTIYILSMRQNYIIAHTRNHTAHTPDWDLEGRGDGGKRKAKDRQRKGGRGRDIKKKERRERRKVTWNDLKVIDTGCSQLRNGQDSVFSFLHNVCACECVCV